MATAATNLKIKKVAVSIDHDATELPFNMYIEGTVRIGDEVFAVNANIGFDEFGDLTNVPDQFKASVETDFDLTIT